MLSWLEFKNEFIKENIINRESNLLPLTLCDLISRKVTLDKTSLEYDFYKSYLISILTSMSYCYMELRNYSEAYKCLSEAAELDGMENPIINFRMAQTIIYNRFSKEEELAEANSYLNKVKRSIMVNHHLITENKELLYLVDREFKFTQELIKILNEKNISIHKSKIFVKNRNN